MYSADGIGLAAPQVSSRIGRVGVVLGRRRTSCSRVVYHMSRGGRVAVASSGSSRDKG